MAELPNADDTAWALRERELLRLLHEGQAALEREQIASAELRRLLGIAQQQLQSLLPAGPEQALRADWTTWREGKKGMGASMTLTGVVAVILGIVLHFALMHHFIDTVVHLGYLVGFVGLVLFLIGLILVV